jgi:hypothetical protein
MHTDRQTDMRACVRAYEPAYIFVLWIEKGQSRELGARLHRLNWSHRTRARNRELRVHTLGLRVNTLELHMGPDGQEGSRSTRRRPRGFAYVRMIYVPTRICTSDRPCTQRRPRSESVSMYAYIISGRRRGIYIHRDICIRACDSRIYTHMHQ